MKRYEKALVYGPLVLIVLLFIFVVTQGARAYTGPANVTSATIGDMRVNPSQGVTWAPGQVLNGTGMPVGGGNSSLSFDGVNQYVSVADDATLDFGVGNTLTITCWIKSSQVATDGYLITKVQAGGNYQGYRLYLDNGVLKGYLRDSSTATVTVTGSNIADGEWHFIVLVRDGTNVVMYIDAAQVDTKPDITADLSNSNTLIIAALKQGVNPELFFDGTLDEIRVYSRALSPTEVAQHYQGIYLNETGLVLYLDFDGEALDYSGEGNDGTPQNGPPYMDGWASVPVTTYYDGVPGVSSRRILVNSTTGDPLSTVPDTAPATWGNYTGLLAPDSSIGNATVPAFIVDTIALDLHAVYSTVPTSLPATIYADAYSLIDGGNLTSADSLTVNGYAFTWNTYTDRFETQITKTTPQSYTLSTVTALSEATYGITAGTVLTPVTVTVVQRGSSLIYQYLPVGDVGGLIFSVYTQALNIQVTWLIIMLIGSVFLYRRLGAIPTALLWLLSWGGFVAVFPPVAINLAVGMLLIGVAAVFFLAFFYWRRSTT